MGLLDDAIREHLDLQRRRGADPAEIERAERDALGPVRRDPPISSGGDEVVFAAVPPPASVDPYAPGDELFVGAEEEQIEAVGAYEDAAPEYEPLPPQSTSDIPLEEKRTPKRRSLLRRRRDAPSPEAAPAALPDDDADDPFLEDEVDPGPVSVDEEGPGLVDDLPPVAPHVDVDIHVPPPAAPIDPYEPPPLPASPYAPPGGDEPPPVPPARPIRSAGPAEPPDLELDHEAGYEEDPRPTLEPDVQPRLPRPRPRRPEPSLGETVEYDVERALAEDEEDELLEETPEFLQDTPDHDRLWFEQKPPKDFDI